MNPINSAGGAASIRDIIALRRQIVDQSKVLQQLNGPGAVQEGAQTTGAATGGFADSLRTALDKVNQSQANADALSEAYQKGEVTDIAKVMLARQEAGLAFEATLQVRNKLLSAYQDIMRMGV